MSGDLNFFYGKCCKISKLQENQYLILNVSSDFPKLAKMSKLTHWSHILHVHRCIHATVILFRAKNLTLLQRSHSIQATVISELHYGHGRPQGGGGAKRAFAPLWNLGLRRKNFWKT